MASEVKPIVYLQDSVNGNPPILCVGANKYPLNANTALLWMKVLLDFMQDRGLKNQ